MSATPILLAAERDSSAWIGPGLLGFAVIVALGVATYLLWRNMNKQIRKVDFDEGPEPEQNNGSGSGSSEPHPSSS